MNYIINWVKLDKYENALRYEIFEHKEYWIVDWIIENSNVIFDLWSNIWLFSYYVKSINNTVKINLFEPVKKLFEKSKLVLNWYDWIVYNNCWVWSIDWEIPVFLNQKINAQCSQYNISNLNKSSDFEICRIINLNSYLESYFAQHWLAWDDLWRIDLMKVDIEGAEYDLLLWLNKINFNKIDNMIIEFHILDDTFKQKHVELIDRLNKFYKLDIKYSKFFDWNIWYILATK